MANTEFAQVCEFFRINCLVLHPDKTKFILFSRSNINQDVDVLGNNNNPGQNLDSNIRKISRVTCNDETPAMKFLGVFFDPELNFKCHIGSLRKKLSRALYALRSVKNTLSSQSLIMLYNSIFHCHVLYAKQIWSCTNSGLINEIFKSAKNCS